MAGRRVVRRARRQLPREALLVLGGVAFVVGLVTAVGHARGGDRPAGPAATHAESQTGELLDERLHLHLKRSYVSAVTTSR